MNPLKLFQKVSLIYMILKETVIIILFIKREADLNPKMFKNLKCNIILQS